jgi:polar amino acid transport system substrate-binding protein
MQKTILFSLLLLVSFHCSLFAADSTAAKKLTVGLAGSEPFVYQNDTTKGIAVDLWDEIATSKGWNYEFVQLPDVEKGLYSLKRKKIDVLVGPISITSKRTINFSFSQPFYNSSLAILSKIEEKSWWEKIKPLFSLQLIGAIAIFLTILGIVGTLVWLAERKSSPDQFPKDPIKGIGNGMWLAIVTMTTTGYGDKAPITLAGRLITGAWMIISIVFATSMVAGIASSLTLSTINSTPFTNIEQLENHRVATVSNSPTVEFLNNNNCNVIEVKNILTAIEKLENSEVEAVVYDRPQLLYFLKNNPNSNLSIAKAEYFKQGYGFAFNINNPIIHELNSGLLNYYENQEINRIINQYLQKDE